MSTATRAEQPAPAPQEIGATLPIASRSRIDRSTLRGFVIVLMALDHTKDFIGPPTFDPLDADVTNLAAGLTRRGSPILRPTFCFLLGSAPTLPDRSDEVELSSFLFFVVILWLVFLEVAGIRMVSG